MEAVVSVAHNSWSLLGEKNRSLLVSFQTVVHSIALMKGYSRCVRVSIA